MKTEIDPTPITVAKAPEQVAAVGDFYIHDESDNCIASSSTRQGFESRVAVRDEIVRRYNAVPNLVGDIRHLRNEVDCRIAHGATGAGHLEYVKNCLDQILSAHSTP